MSRFAAGLSLIALALASGPVPALAQNTAQGTAPPVAAPKPAAISSSALDSSSGDAAADWRSGQPVTAPHAMVVSAQHLATQVGVTILKQGGNAVDAAVAVGYALAVVHPCCGNIGGGGFMTVHLANGQNLFLDFRERAPLKATADHLSGADGNVVKGRSTDTWLGVGTPGTVMGLDEALAKYGTMSLGKVIAPAIALAEKGYVLTPGDIKILDAGSRISQPTQCCCDFPQPWEALAGG